MENDEISRKNLLQHLLPAEILNEKFNLYYQISKSTQGAN